MKRSIIVMAAAMIATSLSSCERNYTCTCVYPYSKAGTTTTNIKAYSRSDAQETCNKVHEGAKRNGGACAL